MRSASTWVVIPARYQSTRLPGKPLLDIHGRPMIAWVYDCAVESGCENIVIATDDEQIQDAAQDFGARAILTSEGHESGTDRIAEVIDHLELPDDSIIVNLQGDEPLMAPVLLQQVSELLRDDPKADMATLMVPIRDGEEFSDPAVVKVVCDLHGRALYFSRSPIPHERDADAGNAPAAGHLYGYRHLGLYAYRAGFLRRFAAHQPVDLEQREKLEQLRALAMGAQIAIDIADEHPHAGVDTADDLQRVRDFLQYADSKEPIDDRS